jgi:hypothetical protein
MKYKSPLIAAQRADMYLPAQPVVRIYQTPDYRFTYQQVTEKLFAERTQMRWDWVINSPLDRLQNTGRENKFPFLDYRWLWHS